MVNIITDASKGLAEAEDYGPTSDDEEQEYRDRLATAEEREAIVPVTLGDGSEVGWHPQAGAQTSFLSNKAFEVLAEGERAGGKSDALLFSFAGEIGLGYEDFWRGILFRESYPQLADIVAKTQRWFPRIWGQQVKFNEQKMMWRWGSGEALLLRHMRKPSDYRNYHGHEYPWQGWEELTAWGNDICYKLMFSCCRTSGQNVPRMVRSNSNPYGIGHAWVKQRFRLPHMRSRFILDSVDLNSGKVEPPRVAIHFPYEQNKILADADPDYKAKVLAAARNKAELAAWDVGDWDVTAGGVFDEAWFLSRKHCVIPDIDPRIVPFSWRLTRAFDWGSSAPFSVGWYAVSDGTDLPMPNGKLRATIRGDVYRFNEWYGWTGRPNEGLRMLASEITEGIVQREMRWGIHGRMKIGPADSQIGKEENGNCIKKDMARPVKIDGRQENGIAWTASDKHGGSRVAGWDRMREMMLATIPVEGGSREKPGLFVCDRCEQYIRTIPSLPRSEKNLDDANTDAEDHIADEVRYMVYNRAGTLTSSKVRGR